MYEKLIIEHCSPTLAGLKAGNMFSVKSDDNVDVAKEIRLLNRMLKAKGLRVIPLKKTSESALIYIYRPDLLKRDLKHPEAENILRKRGYNCGNPECCIAQLAKNMKKGGAFPHEVGLFLGYPPTDVEHFMNNSCEGVICCGCWKAYSNPEKAEMLFQRFRKCREIYRDMNKRGKSLTQLAVITDRNAVG